MHGAWVILASGGDLGEHDYLMDDLVEVAIDGNYRLTLLLYAVFAIALLQTARFFARPLRTALDDGRRVVVSSPAIIAICAVTTVACYALVGDSLALSSVTGISLYDLTRYEGTLGGWYVVLTILNRVALVPAALGLATWLSGPDAKFAVTYRRPFYLFGYLAVLGAMLLLCVLLGNKNEVLFAAVAGGLFYLLNSPRPRVVMLGGSLATIVAMLLMVNVLRSKSVDELADAAALSGSRRDPRVAAGAELPVCRFHVPLGVRLWLTYTGSCHGEMAGK